MKPSPTSDGIQYQNVWVLHNRKSIVSDFTLSVRPGEKILIYGKSGIGKSTLLKLLLGLMPVSRGRIVYRNQPLSTTSVWALRRDAAYVSQSLDLGEGTGNELIREVFGFKVNGNRVLDRDTLDRRLNDLELLPDLLDEPLSRISRGEKQRIALLIAFLLERNLFLLDEPTSAVDAEMKQRIVRLVSSQTERTVLVVSHDSIWLEADGMRVVRMGA